MTRPYCFVLMPFGQKRDGSGATIDFDAVYRDVIRPAIDAADLAPIRADEEKVGGIIQKPMYERLLFCDYAVADLTPRPTRMCSTSWACVTRSGRTAR